MEETQSTIWFVSTLFYQSYRMYGKQLHPISEYVFFSANFLDCISEEDQGNRGGFCNRDGRYHGEETWRWIEIQYSSVSYSSLSLISLIKINSMFAESFLQILL